MGTFGCRSLYGEGADDSDHLRRDRELVRKRSSSGKLLHVVAGDYKKERVRARQLDIELERRHGRATMREFDKNRQTFVWVGNATITESRLAAIFQRKCGGRVASLELRRSGGQAVTKGHKIPNDMRSPRDVLYASIQFEKHESAKRALLYHGAMLDQAPLIVATNVLRMPENFHIMEEQQKHDAALVLARDQILRTAARPLRSYPTVPSEYFVPEESDVTAGTADGRLATTIGFSLHIILSLGVLYFIDTMF